MVKRMKCPDCKKEGVKFCVKIPSFTKKEDKKKYKRTNFEAECKKCGWMGEM